MRAKIDDIKPKTFNLFAFSSIYYKGYAYVLLHSNFKARKHAQELLKKIFKWDTSKLVISLCEYMNTVISDSNSALHQQASIDISGEKTLQWPMPKSLIEFIFTLANIKNLTSKELETLTVKCLMLANSKLAKQFDKKLFSKFFHKLVENNKANINTSVEELLCKLTRDFIEHTTEGQILNEVVTFFQYKHFFKRISKDIHFH